MRSTSLSLQTAHDQTHKTVGCFVAGTLVHTQTGLRPIEQIKVGDFVLSKPEGGVGETSYQRVTQAFVYDDRELYLVRWVALDVAGKETKEFGHMVVTGAHPIWVNELKESHIDDTWKEVELTTTVDGWMSIEDLYGLHWEKMYGESSDGRGGGVYPRITVLDGRTAEMFQLVPILRSADPDMGVSFDEAIFNSSREGVAIYFAAEGPKLKLNERGGTPRQYLDSDITLDYDYSGYDRDDPESIAYRSDGFLPIRRRVFNLEVESNHSYFVGEAGVWVHDAGDPEIIGAPTPL